MKKAKKNIILNNKDKSYDELFKLIQDDEEAKVKALRSRKVEVPILFVPPHVKKSQIYLPNNGEILIDDSIKNLIDWEQKGGKSIYFNEDLDSIGQFETVKTLSRIL